MSEKLLNVRIDYINIDQAVERVTGWLKKRGKHYVVTPNPEMLVDANFDEEFLKILNNSNLAIPDSSRLGWGSYVKSQKNVFLRLISIPAIMFPRVLPRFSYPTTTGVDLMERLLSLSQEKGFTTAYLGGSKNVADKLAKCLRLKYPGLKIAFCAGNMYVNLDGEMQIDTQRNKMTQSKDVRREFGIWNLESGEATNDKNSFNHHQLSQKIDILFVAFGHKKQEKWISRNIGRLNTRVMIGVGGAFDYISGEVPRAPQIMRKIGLEWLFRFIVQPWRIKRLWKLFYYLYLILISK